MLRIAVLSWQLLPYCQQQVDEIGGEQVSVEGLKRPRKGVHDHMKAVLSFDAGKERGA